MKNNIPEKRILIVEVNWLGDVLFSTPFIKSVREKFKDSYIALLTVPRTKEILENNPRINEIIIYDEKGEHKSLLGKWRLIKILKEKKFDLAIILHRSFTRALITFLSGIKRRVGFATKKRRFLLTDPVDIPGEDLHKVEYFLKLAEYLGCDTSSKDYEFFVTDKERSFIENTLSKKGIKKEDTLVVINPGGNWLPKRWDEESFAKLSDVLIDKYNVKIIISGAKKDAEIAEHIKSMMKNNAVALSGETSLKELAALMERASFVISGDSGPMHIAVSLRKPNVIALFGPTSPELTGPYGKGSYKILRKDIGCEVPCYDLSCGDYKCMKAIKVEDVLGIFEKIYKYAESR